MPEGDVVPYHLEGAEIRRAGRRARGSDLAVGLLEASLRHRLDAAAAHVQERPATASDRRPPGPRRRPSTRRCAPPGRACRQPARRGRRRATNTPASGRPRAAAARAAARTSARESRSGESERTSEQRVQACDHGGRHSIDHARRYTASRPAAVAARAPSEVAMSHLFAYFSRMKFIRRWGLMRSTYTENVQEHSQRVALVAHALALIRNRLYGGSGRSRPRRRPRALPRQRRGPHRRPAVADQVPQPRDPLRLPRDRGLGRDHPPRHGARAAARRLPFAVARRHGDDDDDERAIVKAADKLCAWMKCLEETAAGNREFAKAEEALREMVAVDRAARGALVRRDLRPQLPAHARRIGLEQLPPTPACEDSIPLSDQEQPPTCDSSPSPMPGPPASAS